MAMNGMHITASTPLTPLLSCPGLRRKLEKSWDASGKKRHLVADRFHKSPRLPTLEAPKKSKFRAGRSGSNLFHRSFRRKSQPLSFLKRTKKGPVRVADTLQILKRIESYRLQQKQQNRAVIKMQRVYRDHLVKKDVRIRRPVSMPSRQAAPKQKGQFPGRERNMSSSVVENRSSMSRLKPAAKLRGSVSPQTVKRRRQRGTSRKRQAKKTAKKAAKKEVPESPDPDREKRQQWLDSFRTKREAKKAAKKEAKRRTRQLALEASNADREQEVALRQLRQRLLNHTVHYHDLYAKTMEKVRGELVAAGHASAATKMQRIWRINRAHTELKRVDSSGAGNLTSPDLGLSADDLALLETMHGTRNIRDVDAQAFQSDLQEAKDALDKIQALVRGRISRSEVAVLRSKLKQDAAAPPLQSMARVRLAHQVAEARQRPSPKLGADDNFLLMAMYDDDASSTLDAQELANFLADLGMPHSQDDIRAVMAKMDADGDGRIDFTELVATLPPTVLTRLKASGYMSGRSV